MIHAFLSLSKKNIRTGRKIQKHLWNLGIRVWFFELELLPGDLWEEILKRAIWDSDSFLVILSKASIQKKSYVQKEIKWAIEKEKKKGTTPKQSSIILAYLDEKGRKWIEGEKKLRLYHRVGLKKRTSLEDIKDKILNRKRCHQFVKKSGIWEEAESRKCVAKYEPLKDKSQPNCLLSFEPDNPYTCEDLKSISCTVKIKNGYKEWRAGILLRQYDAYMDPNRVLFFIADKEWDWDNKDEEYKKRRPFGEVAHIGCYALSDNLVTMDIYAKNEYRPRIPDTLDKEFIFNLEVTDGYINCRVLDTNKREIGDKFIVTKNTVCKPGIVIDRNFKINDIREVCLWASTKVDKEAFEIEFSEVSIEGLGYKEEPKSEQ